MAFNKTKRKNQTKSSGSKRLKSLYRQLNKFVDQPTDRLTNIIVNDVEYTSIVLTRRGRIERAIQTLENSK